jgi:hypothetical protein
MLKSDLEACSIEIKELKHILDHHSRYGVPSPPCEVCVTLKDKLFQATKENSEFKSVCTQVASQLENSIYDLDELKAKSSLLDACLECPKLKLELDARSLMLKNLRQNYLRSHVF